MNEAIKIVEIMPKNSQRNIPLHYSRKKDAVEINGHPDDVRKLAWFDMLFTKSLWLVITLILLFILPKASLIPVLWKYIKGKFFLIPLLVLVDSLLSLSG